MKRFVVAVFAFLALTASALAASPTVFVDNGEGHGSGVYIGDAYVVTAAHVVTGKEFVTVIDDDGEKHKAHVEIVNVMDDVAVLEIVRPDNLEAAVINCNEPTLGTEVTIEGYPRDLGFVVTYGRVAGLDTAMYEDWWREYILVDGSSLPGNSGGPVFNEDREVVGILVGGITEPDRQGITGYSPDYSIVVPSNAICRTTDLLVPYNR